VRRRGSSGTGRLHIGIRQVARTVDFAPTWAKRNKIWIWIGATLGVGSISMIGLVHALVSPADGFAGMTSVLNAIATTPPAFASALSSSSAAEIRNTNPVSEPASAFADRFAFSRVDDASAYARLVPPPPSYSLLPLWQPRRHWQTRHKSHRHRPTREVQSHWWLTRFLNLSRLEPHPPGRR